MADNQGSRTFLAIVLGGIVLALVIAASFMYGHKGEMGVKIQPPASRQAAPSNGPATSGNSAQQSAPQNQ